MTKTEATAEVFWTALGDGVRPDPISDISDYLVKKGTGIYLVEERLGEWNWRIN